MITSEIKPVGTLGNFGFQAASKRRDAMAREALRKVQAAGRALDETARPRVRPRPSFEVIEGEKDTKRDTPREFTQQQRDEAARTIEKATGDGDAAFPWKWVVGGVVTATTLGLGFWWWRRRRAA